MSQQPNESAFLTLLRGHVKTAFLNAVGQDEEQALTAMREFAKLHVLDDEHYQIDSMNMERLIVIVTNMAAADPEGLREILDAAKLAHDALLKQHRDNK